jgi:hypothetical protein
VDGAVRRQALKTLFADPRFNVMDGLDVYIDDYSKPDPLPPGWLEKMEQVAHLGIYKPPAPEGEEVARSAAPAIEGAPQEAASPAAAQDPAAETQDRQPPPAA